MPASRSDLVSGSLSNSFRPTKLTVAMIERSSTITTATRPSISSRTSLNRPVPNKRAQGGRALVVGVGVADAEGQRGKDRAGVGALQALDADVLDDEGLDGSRRRCGRDKRNRYDERRNRAQRPERKDREHVLQCRPSRRATSLKRATDIIVSSTAMPPRCSRASQRSETGRPVTPSKM